MLLLICNYIMLLLCCCYADIMLLLILNVYYAAIIIICCYADIMRLLLFAGWGLVEGEQTVTLCRFLSESVLSQPSHEMGSSGVETSLHYRQDTVAMRWSMKHVDEIQ